MVDLRVEMCGTLGSYEVMLEPRQASPSVSMDARSAASCRFVAHGRMACDVHAHPGFFDLRRMHKSSALPPESALNE